MKEAAAAIECRKLTKTYGRNGATVQALKGIDLRVGQGEFLVLMGKNGSGKSTLLGILGAMLQPTSGEVVVNATDIGRLPESGLAHFRAQQVGFIFQDFNLLKGFTVFENMELALLNGDSHKRQARERIMTLLERVKLTHRVHHFPKELSAGEQQRAAVARALVNNPPVILADEPAAETDPAGAEEILGLLFEKNRNEGVTVVLATHGAFTHQAGVRRCYLHNGNFVPAPEQ